MKFADDAPKYSLGRGDLGRLAHRDFDIAILRQGYSAECFVVTRRPNPEDIG